MEVLENTTRENYNKVIIKKKMWIPVAENIMEKIGLDENIYANAVPHTLIKSAHDRERYAVHLST